MRLEQVTARSRHMLIVIAVAIVVAIAGAAVNSGLLLPASVHEVAAATLPANSFTMTSQSGGVLNGGAAMTLLTISGGYMLVPGTTTVAAEPLVITKNFDAGTPDLLQQLVTHGLFTQTTINTGGLTITLVNSSLTEDHIDAQGGASGAGTERITLHYACIRVVGFGRQFVNSLDGRTSC